MSLANINDLITKKFKTLQKEIKDFNQMFLGLKTGFAMQIGETRKAIEQLGGLISTVAKAVDKKLDKMENKPCMKIKTIFTEEQVKKLLELIK
jgi:hypothetical protein